MSRQSIESLGDVDQQVHLPVTFNRLGECGQFGFGSQCVSESSSAEAPHVFGNVVDLVFV